MDKNQVYWAKVELISSSVLTGLFTNPESAKDNYDVNSQIAINQAQNMLENIEARKNNKVN